MAGKGESAKGKNRPKHRKHGQKQTADGFIANSVHEGPIRNENRESDENNVLGNDDYKLLEGINITSSNPPNPNETSSDPTIPHRRLSANQSVFLKGCMTCAGL